MITTRQLERRLAVITNWGVAGSFGLGLIQTGFGDGNVPIGLAGFGLIAAGFVSQVIVNKLYSSRFSRGEIAFGIAAFGIAVLTFIFAWLFDPAFDGADMAIGISGFAGLIGCFLIYLIARYGLKGSFSMFHRAGEPS
ncbi:MAG TPA: hypothetical protein VKN76_06290 [Kiloniellaceae bacterium]|nr:hypothetical protein [Kiloniellaceae bacterium]